MHYRISVWILVMLFPIFLLPFPAIEERSNETVKAELAVRDIMDQMLKSINNIKTLKYTLKVSERIKGKMTNSESMVKLQRTPRKLYMLLKGPELLWVQGERNGEALVNPNAFPYFNLNLDPYASLLRANQHHTIHEIGFDYFADIMQNEIKKVGDKFDKCFFYMGEEKWNSRNCYKILITCPEFSFSKYTVKKNENIVTIARKLRISEYLILENNPKISGYYSVKEGDQIEIPNVYAKMTILFIDKQYNLPVGNRIYDNKGLFESYEYHNLQVNPKIDDAEFTAGYKDYHF